MWSCVPLFAAALVSAAGLTLSGTGSEGETKYTETYQVKPFAPYRISFEAKKAGPETAGRTICAGFPGLNVDLDLREAWTSYADIVMTAMHDGPSVALPVRFSLWMVSGDVDVRNWRVAEQQAVHATDGTVTLGDGEMILGSEYVFIDRPGSAHHNHSRPLHAWRGAVRLNTDRYPIADGGEIVWRHAVAGRQFLSGSLALPAKYFGSGRVRLDVSKDGAVWTPVGALDATNRIARIGLPDTLFPADCLFVRATGEKAVGVQLGAYGFSARLDGPRRFVAGRTIYADAGVAVDPPTFTVPELHRADYGERVPGSTPSLALWRASSGWHVSRTRPVPAAEADVLALSLAANETEAVQLVLTPSETLSNVTVSVDLPSFEANVRRVAYVQVDWPVDHTTVPGWFPDPLPPQTAPLTLAANENQPFWITVKAPKGTAKGVYRGRVTVRGTGKTAFVREVPLVVEVFGFALPDRMTCRSLFGFYPQMVDRYHGLVNREDRLRVYDLYMRAFADYHLSPSAGATYGRRAWHPRWDGDTPVFDWTEWDEGVARGFEQYHFTALSLSGGLGLGGCDAQHRRVPEIGGVKEGDPRYEVRLAKLLKGVQDHLEAKGWLDRVYIYCFDEPQEKDNAFVMAAFAKLAKYAPKLRRFLTSPCRRDLLGGPQVWCPIAPDLESPLARARQELGEEFWLYVCMAPCAPYATEFIDHPAIDLRAWLWQSWAARVAGVLIWSSNWWTAASIYPDPAFPQNPYVDAQAWNPWGGPWGNGDGRIFYPPECVFEDPRSRRTRLKPGPHLEAPVGSIRGEMLRDGIEDYEYFAILKAHDPAHPLLVVPPDVSKSLSDFSTSPVGIEAHRVRLARAIERAAGGL